jgi:hypothetical protein
MRSVPELSRRSTRLVKDEIPSLAAWSQTGRLREETLLEDYAATGQLRVSNKGACSDAYDYHSGRRAERPRRKSGII